MKSKDSTSTKWRTRALLGLTIVLGTGTGAYTFSPLPAQAASVSAQQSATVYNQFEKYLKNPASLAHARNYLINHIDEAGIWRGTVMTLHLENAQRAQLNSISEKIYPDKIQKAIDSAFKLKNYNRSELTYTYLLSVVKESNIRSVLIELRDKGYKIETSEGMYYPVMHYEGFKVFKPYIQKDIAAYIDIMAKESNKPSLFDAAIVISWEELIARSLEKEVFIKKYPKSNRMASIQINLSVSYLFYGSSNTPAYGYDKPTRIDPDLRKAYDSALSKGTKDSDILKMIDGLVKLLDKTNNVLTADVEQYIQDQLKPYNN
ncbi:hypothetical protein [Paenibacillus wynnii]|uniref:Uncharacterized protein n=1 Tax=Paenibacillus wynnii TaxID=268407 RepID=A0A098M3Q4_9BACL|nr:hypothetical protein [Paenibacillus wynnii]KGE17180.1 hypothetical protein PWYN_21325 [Paenibacillus wynnii]